MHSEGKRFYRFDDFVIDAGRRLLLRDDRPVPLNPRAFDLLLALVEHRSQVLTKDELLDRVWPDQTVEEGNLPVHVSAVRKALGERRGENRYVVTMPGRGYRFVADVTELDGVVRARERWRTPIALAGAVGVLLATGFAYELWSRTRTATDLGTPAGAARTTRQLTAVGNVSSAALSRDGRSFVYVQYDRGKESLWLAPVNGGVPIELRPPEDVDYQGLTFTADGARVLYSMRGTLYALSTSGGTPRRFHERVDSGFSVSPDGTRIAFIRRDAQRHVSAIMVADLNGAAEREVSVLPSGQGFSFYGPAWSPDETRLAIGVGAQTAEGHAVLMCIRLADGTVRALSTQTWSSIGKVAWLHDGSGIVFNAVGADSDYHIWLLDIATGELRKVTNDLSRYGRASVSVSDDGQVLLAVRSEGNAAIWAGSASDAAQSRQVTSRALGKLDGSAGLSWTPDGRIAYASFFANSSSVWMTGVGSDARQVTSSGFLDTFPRVTADGRYIVFASDRSGGSDIWRVNVAGGDLRQLTTGGRNAQPDTTRDSRSVLYVASDDGDQAVWKMSIDGGSPVRLIEGASWPRVSPDGRMVACVHTDKASPAISRLAVFSLDDGRPIARFDVAHGATLNNGIQWTPDGASLVYRDFGEGLWRQPLAGGSPQKMPDVRAKRIYFFDWSRDGRQFAMSYGDELRDVVLVTHFR